jgi:hypothetical protein
MYEDITIVDLDLKKTTWSRVHTSMRTLHLKLSREPDLEWVRYFNTERESRVVPTRHGLWIEEGYIVFDCLLQNVERYHLPDFQQSIDYANERSHERVEERREERAQRRAEITEEHDVLESLRSKIRHDEVAEPDLSFDAPTLDAVIDLPDALATEAIPDAVEETPAKPIVEPPAPAVPVAEKAANDEDDFDSRRSEWRERFRKAMKFRKDDDSGDPQ